VVKELVENALDAGATRVEVELEEAGRRRITVRDDGIGMAEADARMALQRHATSKIREVLDLQRAGTLGFRGEALPSIASVSRFTLTTGTEDGARFRVVIEGGQETEAGYEAGPRGTEISVEDLFYNMPARLKFLKSDTTELAQCLETVQRLALAYPSVAFTVRTPQSVALSAPGDGDQAAALAACWGWDTVRGLVALDHYENGVRVRGLASPPHQTRPTRAYQWFLVNRRPIRSRGLQVALDIAYRSLTPERRFPLVALSLDVDPSRVDANVSPTKNEVRFQRDADVFDAVRHAVRDALLQQGMIPSAEGLATANAALAALRAPSLYAGYTPPTPAPSAADPGWAPLFSEVFPPGCSNTDARPASSAFGLTDRLQAPLRPPVPGETNAYGALLDGLRIIGQAMETFILAENRQGLLIIDQHVAHERILYEMLARSRGMGAVERQTLLAPEVMHLDRLAAERLRDCLPEVAEVGFDIEPFGGESFLVRSIPAALKGRNPLGILRDLADELAEGARPAAAREAIWIMASCKMAIKAGDSLGRAEMEQLMRDLADTENPYLCPHGRPITVVLDRGALFRLFKR